MALSRKTPKSVFQSSLYSWILPVTLQNLSLAGAKEREIMSLRVEE